MSAAFNPHASLIVVEARLFGPRGDQTVQLALDTGASGSLVHPAVLRIIGYDPVAAPERVRITTGTGVEFVPHLPVVRIEALRQMRRNFAILAHALPPTATIDGLLGLDFVRGQCLTIDFRAGQITLA